MGLKEPGMREKANHGQYMMWKSENESRQTQSNESKESKGLMTSPWTPKMRNNVIGPGKPKEFNKSPWECKVKKRVEEAQEKQTGPRRPRENNKWDIRARQWYNKRTNGRAGLLGEEWMAGPKRPNQIEVKQLCNRNDRVVWQKMVVGKMVGWRKAKPTVKQGLAPNRVSHKGKGN